MIYMNNKNIIRNYDIMIIFLLVTIDYFSKYYFSILLNNNRIWVIWDYLFLQIYKNNWIAFSLELPFLKLITSIIIILIVFYYFFYEKKKNNILIDICFILIISWALWNARERILLWEVTDFIWVKNFSIFNFADIYINIWIIFYLIIIILKKDREWI